MRRSHLLCLSLCLAISILGEVNQAPASPLTPQLLSVVTRASAQEWPGVPVVPMMVPYATDGTYLRAAGIPTYGIQGFFMDRDDIRFHGRDERLLITSFYEAQAFLYNLSQKPLNESINGCPTIGVPGERTCSLG